MKFFYMTKADQLQLLGDLYTMMASLSPLDVNLNTVMRRKEVGCGSIGCLLGWAATDPKLGNRLGVVQSTDTLLRFNSGARKNQPITYDLVFHERRLSTYLFGPCVEDARFQLLPRDQRYALYKEFGVGLIHQRVALFRLLAIGHLIDSDTIDRAFWEAPFPGARSGNIQILADHLRPVRTNKTLLQAVGLSSI